MRLNLVVLTPTHIGEGDNYLPSEVYIKDGKASVVDFESLVKQLAEKIKNPYLLREKFKTLANEVRNKGEYLTFEGICELFGIRPEEINFNYSVSSDNLKNRIGQVEKFIKTLGKVFIPGSEIKGAFRTAYAYHLLINNGNFYNWFEENLKRLLDRIRYLDERRQRRELNKFANQLENYLFSSQAVRSPATADIFKLVHISDSEAKEPQEVLTLKELRLLGNSEQFLIWSECLKPSTVWKFELKVQVEVKEYLNSFFGDLADRNKYLTGEIKLLEIVDNFFRDFIDFELQRLEGELQKPLLEERKKYEQLKEVYIQLKEVPKEGEKVFNFLVRLGKHTGRYLHTILLALWKKNSPLLPSVLETFHSKTRWLTKENLPLGWCNIFVPKKS